MTASPTLVDLSQPAAPHALQTEWLLTNGLGAFAMGTAPGVNSRRYHGLLIATTHPPIARIVALHSLIDTLILGSETIDLSVQQFGTEAALHPDGHRRLRQCTFDPPANRVTWRSEHRGVRIEKTLRIVPGRNEAHIMYDIHTAEAPARLSVRALTPMRDFHEVDADWMAPPTVTGGLGDLIVQRDDRELHLAAKIESPGAKAKWREDGQWWRQFAYTEDRARGQNWLEDVYSPGVCEIDLPAHQHSIVRLVAVLTEPVFEATITRPEVPPGATSRAEQCGRLELAADQFIVKRLHNKRFTSTILAGYPWFADWGRDTMISLPGLMLATKRFEEARSVLEAFGRRVRGGLLPNLFSDYSDDAAYNTVDASLWYIHAVREYALASGDYDIAPLLGACRQIIAGYCAGADFGIELCEDGLITCGDGGHPVTWMDAQRGGITFTPRDGKTVEINALWRNALLSLADLSANTKEIAELTVLAQRCTESFREKFWWPERACLHDVLLRDRHWEPDGTLRPNQIFAVSLPFSPLEKDQQKKVVAAVREHLLTPVGLRTLSPDDPGYVGRFEGDLMQRDAAYHNGTVWPWLIGGYCEAVLRADHFSPAACSEVEQIIARLCDELDTGCLGQLAEVYDGDEPRRGQGCPAQAWSIAEPLRILRLLDHHA